MQKKELKNTANPLSLSEETIYERPELLIPSPNDIIEMGQADGTERITTRQELYDDIKEKVVLPEIPPPFELPIYLQGVPAGFSPTVMLTTYNANNNIDNLTTNLNSKRCITLDIPYIEQGIQTVNLDFKPHSSLYNTDIYLDILVRYETPSVVDDLTFVLNILLNGKNIGVGNRISYGLTITSSNVYQLQGWHKIDGDGDIFKY